jgi:uncharacterized membrane protein YukC
MVNKMKFKDFLSIEKEPEINENKMKFEALSIAKDIHGNLANITFLDMIAVMNPDNPAKKEVQELEKKLNDLTGEVGEFIQKYIPDVQDAEVGDEREDSEEEPEEEEPESKDKEEEK